MPDPKFTDGKYTEIVEGWTLWVYDHTPGCVHATGPSPRCQEVEVEDGNVCLNVTEYERGHGYDGDTASDRAAPVYVIEAAIRLWRALGGR